MNKNLDKQKLAIQLEAVDEYINKLAKYEKEGLELHLAYQELVNDLRQRAGLKALRYQNLKGDK